MGHHRPTGLASEEMTESCELGQRTGPMLRLPKDAAPPPPRATVEGVFVANQPAPPTVQGKGAAP